MIDRESSAPPRPRGRPRIPEAQRFAAMCAPANSDDCILWTGGRTNLGAPAFTTRDADDRIRIVPARRHLYSILIGPLTPGQSVHSTCGNPLCVAVSHMTLARRKEPPADTDLTPAQRQRRNYLDIINSPHNLREFHARGWATSQLASVYGISEHQVAMLKYHYPPPPSEPAAT